MEAYLDNSATTRCYEEVKDIVVKTMMDDYGNPSAMHQKGVESERYVKEAAGQIATTLKVQEKEIYFTSGGTDCRDRRADQAGKSENVFSCGCDSGLRKVPDPSEKDAYRYAFRERT